MTVQEAAERLGYNIRSLQSQLARHPELAAFIQNGENRNRGTWNIPEESLPILASLKGRRGRPVKDEGRL